MVFKISQSHALSSSIWTFSGVVPETQHKNEKIAVNMVH